eukprot:g5783.t1
MFRNKRQVKRDRRRFIVDGKEVVGRAVPDQVFPLPWTEKKIVLSGMKTPEMGAKRRRMAGSQSSPGLMTSGAPLSLDQFKRASTSNLNSSMPFLSPNRKSVSFSAPIPNDDKFVPQSYQTGNYIEQLKSKKPAYTMPSGRNLKPFNHGDSPGPQAYPKPCTPSKYRHYSHSPIAVPFTTAPRSICQTVSHEDWMKRWRPKNYEFGSSSVKAGTYGRKRGYFPSLKMPQLRRNMINDKFDYNSALGGSFNAYIRPSTKRSSKILQNEALILETRKNIWKSLRYQESMHLPNVVMKRMKKPKCLLSDEERRRRKRGKPAH